MSEAIIADQVVKTFHDGKLHVEVLKRLSLQVQTGEMLAIIGASGSGKSTLLHLLGGLDRPSEGVIRIAGKDLSLLSENKLGALRNHYLGFVYQFHHLLPEYNAVENVAMPLLIRGVKPKKAIQLADKLLEQVSLLARRDHRVGELSGGERQRVAIARALVTEPHCVLADEPTGNLDQVSAEHVFELMRELNQSMKTSFVVVTHNEQLASRLDRVLILRDGCLIEASK